MQAFARKSESNQCMMADKGSSSKKQSLNTSATSGSSSDDKTSGGVSTRLRTDVVLPQTRIRGIMKSSPEIDALGADAVFMITKATVKQSILYNVHNFCL